MSNSLSNQLCRGLRACGIPRKQAFTILNIVEKWIRENGVEWTNGRIKDLRQWYETCLTGNPVPPEWFRHSKEGYPLGIWKWVFNLPKAKALGVLSLNTVFYESRLSKTQKEKFLKSLHGNGSQNPELVLSAAKDLRDHWKWLVNYKKMPEILFPTVFDMNGSVPVHDGSKTVRPDGNISTALEALELSWDSVPQVTFDFLLQYRQEGLDLTGYMPPHVVGNDYMLELERPHSSIVGRVSVLQQPQLKARIVGNPNRVLQVTLDPLKEVYMTTLRKLPTDVTHDQESGVAWVQAKLAQGIELAGSDLTSASDLLDIGCCLTLVDHVFRFDRILGYSEFERYLLEVSRSNWFCPVLNQVVKWEQGSVLGTGPSFGLLSLTNNCAALYAWKQARAAGAIDKSIYWHDAFRVVGDDIVMVSAMEPYYTRTIEALGGEINHSKTLKSNKVAEFAGRVITSNGSFLKAIKYSEPSDNSFMSYVSQLGDQAKRFLKPRQQKVYSLFREVPGVVVPGPWNPDSFGLDLASRYQWYLEEVQPALSRMEPDHELEDYQLTLLKAQLGRLASGHETTDDRILDTPLVDSGYLPEQVTPSFRKGGDPRLTDGKTMLEALEAHAHEITPYEIWRNENPSGLATGSSDEEITITGSGPSELDPEEEDLDIDDLLP